MEITESKTNGASVLHLKGRLDGVAAPELENKLADLMADGCERLIFDCSGVEYASSAGHLDILEVHDTVEQAAA